MHGLDLVGVEETSRSAVGFSDPPDDGWDLREINEFSEGIRAGNGAGQRTDSAEAMLAVTEPPAATVTVEVATASSILKETKKGIQ